MNTADIEQLIVHGTIILFYFILFYFILFYFILYFYKFSAIFTMLFLRKSFWPITINTFFIFHTPFSMCFFITSCHYNIVTENISNNK